MSELAIIPPSAMAVSGAMTIQEIIAQKKLVAQCVSELMKDGEHYGTIPGTEKKDGTKDRKTLYKPGADLLCSLFQLVADYETLEAVRTPTLIYYRLKCTLTSANSGIRRGSGLGSCNSHEEKYLRAAGKKCPKCNKETILRSKLREGERGEPGWFCWAKKGGCGANFVHDDPAIIDQETGIKDPADLDNTILKMAAKRSRVDAVLTVTGASDFFTQDVEDLTEREVQYIPPPKASADPKAESAGQTRSSRETSQTTGPKAPAAPRANTVKHSGAKASPEAVKMLHTLRAKVGGLVVCDPKSPCPYPNKKRCGYHTQLAAFKDSDGNPVKSSKDLSPEQIANLIGRYEKKITEQGMRAAQDPDIGAMQTGKVTHEGVKAVGDALLKTDMDAQELCAVFSVDDISQLTYEAAGDALALVLSWGTPNYSRLLAEITGVER